MNPPNDALESKAENAPNGRTAWTPIEDPERNGMTRDLGRDGLEQIEVTPDGVFIYTRQDLDGGLNVSERLSPYEADRILRNQDAIAAYLKRRRRLELSRVRASLKQVLERLEEGDEFIDAWDLEQLLTDNLREGTPETLDNAVHLLDGPPECPGCSKPTKRSVRLFECENEHHYNRAGELIESDVFWIAFLPALKVAMNQDGIDYEALREA